MESRKRISVLLLLSFLLSVAVAHQGHSTSDESSPSGDSDLDSQGSSSEPHAQRRSGLFHNSGLHYHLPATTGFAYAAKPYYTPLVKYPVYKTYATAAPAFHNHHVHTYARPQYSLHHGGASVASYNVNYPRYPLYRPVLKVPTTTILKPTIHSAPSFYTPIAPVAPVLPPKSIIPIAYNPFPTPARPIVYPQQTLFNTQQAVFNPQPTVFNPSILAGLNPQFVPVSSVSSWKPIAVPTVPTIVQRPSIGILPPFGAPSSTIATLSDPIHGHHQFAQHVPSTPVTVAADSHDHQHFLPSGASSS